MEISKCYKPVLFSFCNWRDGIPPTHHGLHAKSGSLRGGDGALLHCECTQWGEGVGNKEGGWGGRVEEKLSPD